MNKSLSRFTFTLLNADYVRLNKNWNYRNVISPFYRLYLIDKGAGTLSTSSQSVLLTKAYLYLIPSFTICNYYCPTFLHQHYLHFIEESADGTSLFLWNRRIFKLRATQTDVANFKRLLQINPGRGLIKSEDPKDYEKRPIIESFKDMNDLLHASSYMETNGIILQLLSRFLAADEFKFGKENVIPSKISQSINHIQTHLDHNLTVADLAAAANLSNDHFSSIFAEHVGERPIAYIQSRRIERAQFLISTTDLSLTEIAEQTGFDTLSYFSRVFRKITGQSPSAYKGNRKAV